MIMHWGTFQLGDEPVHLPPQHMRAEMRQAGLLDRLVDWKHGETVISLWISRFACARLSC